MRNQRNKRFQLRESFRSLAFLLDQRIIISEKELMSYLSWIFPGIFSDEEKVSFDCETITQLSNLSLNLSEDEAAVAEWLLNICVYALLSKYKIVYRLFSDSKVITTIHSIPATYLPDNLWETILKHLSVKDRSKITHVSKKWHQLTQNSPITEIVAPFKYIDGMGMSYLLMHNCTKRNRLFFDYPRTHVRAC